jgi:hypothetical protein
MNVFCQFVVWAILSAFLVAETHHSRGTLEDTGDELI